MPAARTVRLPGPAFASKDLPEHKVDGLEVLRVHGANHPPTQFRTVPGHRFSHPDAPSGQLYLGHSLETCLLEVFGDTLLDGNRRDSLPQPFRFPSLPRAF